MTDKQGPAQDTGRCNHDWWPPLPGVVDEHTLWWCHLCGAVKWHGEGKLTDGANALEAEVKALREERDEALTRVSNIQADAETELKEVYTRAEDAERERDELLKELDARILHNTELFMRADKAERELAGLRPYKALADWLTERRRTGHWSYSYWDFVERYDALAATAAEPAEVKDEA